MKRYYLRKILIVILIALLCGGGLIFYKYKNKSTYLVEQLEILKVKENINIKSQKKGIVNNSRFMHVSLDDFIIAFEDITKNESKYKSIFDNDTFSYLKDLHDKYGAVISCYSYYENDDASFNLSKCTNKFAKEFEENSDWLKFGFHTYNGSKNYEKTSSDEAKSDYNKVISELLRITGSESCIDKVVRLQNFAGNEESIEAMINTENGIEGVLGADDKRRSYYLNNEDNSYLYTYDYYEVNNFEFFRTDLRMELINDIDKELEKVKNDSEYENKKDILIVFTHEWQLVNEEIKEKLEKCCEFAVNNGYVFDYPMNRI